MIRGWRLNPEWVNYYKTRDEERIKRELKLMDLESKLIATKNYIDALNAQHELRKQQCAATS